MTRTFCKLRSCVYWTQMCVLNVTNEVYLAKFRAVLTKRISLSPEQDTYRPIFVCFMKVSFRGFHFKLVEKWKKNKKFKKSLKTLSQTQPLEPGLALQTKQTRRASCIMNVHLHLCALMGGFFVSYTFSHWCVQCISPLLGHTHRGRQRWGLHDWQLVM